MTHPSTLIKHYSQSKRRGKIIGFGAFAMASILTTLLTLIEKKLQQLTSPPREEIINSPEDFGLNYENLETQTPNQKLVSGWLIRPENNGGQKTTKVVILSHGYGKNRSAHPAVLQMAKHLVQNGVACILYDFENHGLIKGKKTSDDGRTTIGAKTEKNDLHTVIDHAKELGYTDIGLVGVSMGAATSLQVAAERDDIQMVVADSAFTSLKSYLFEQISVWDKRIKPWMIKTLLKYVKVFKGIDVNQIQPIEAIKDLGKRGVEVRLIHTIGDQVTPEKNSIELAQAYLAAYNQSHTTPKKLDDVRMLTKSYSEKFQREDTTQRDHCRSIDVDPDGYRSFVVDSMIEKLGKVKPELRPTNQPEQVKFFSALKRASKKINPITVIRSRHQRHMEPLH